MTSAVDDRVGHQLKEYLAQQRWFAGKGRSFEVTGRRTFPWLSAPDALPALRVELVTVAYGDDDVEVYQVPMAYYTEIQEHLSHALVGTWSDPDIGEVMAYDGLHDREATGYLLNAVLHQWTVPGLEFHCLEETPPDIDGPSLLLPGEQSNSSLVYGEDALLKVFRKVAPGRNPDIEIHEVLTHDGVDKVAALYGWVSASWEGTDELADLAMLQQFLRTATNGWTMALGSVRDLYAEADLHADEVGGDFAAEAHRLGAATAEVHGHLAALLGTQTWSAGDLERLAAAMQERLDAAAHVVPALDPHASGLRQAFDAMARAAGEITVQRVHGDLHLGQTLRTVLGWKLIDFEGEPVKSLADRTALDSPLRDVAAMLRSFDYAAATLLTDHPHDAQIAYRAREWSQRNRDAFCAGYAEESALDPRAESVLMRAYETDKAVYEVVYEARNRPTWLPIPMAAISRLSGSEPGSPTSTSVGSFPGGVV